jgi:subtilisin
MRTLGSVAAAAALLVGQVALGATGVNAGQERPGVAGLANPDRIDGRYIVVLDDTAQVGAAVRSAQQAYGAAAVQTVYRSALPGFVARMTRDEAASMAGTPGVRFVQADVRVRATVQRMPTGVNRANADASPTARINGRDQRVGVDVAVVDTGVDLNNPELNVVRAGARNCVGQGVSADDRNGHGSHVAGTIGALDNRRGVVGVAPGARIWPVRVLGPDGSGSLAQALCGIDFVTANARRIEVANLSLAAVGQDDGNCGRTNQDALHMAICRSVAAGVTYVVAAGNAAQDAALFVPAAYDEVVTVSALADFNGRPGGGAPATCVRDVDDTFASFSNFGQDVDMVAPGVCIRSTWMNGQFRTISGTSMATPAVAGGAALYIARHPAAGPAQVRQALRTAGSATWNGADDPDAVREPLLDVSGF